jgi:tetratricopeptide (TPR) repeat protein
MPWKEANRKARQAVTTALSLDPTLGEAHASLGQLLMTDDWDFAGADREFKRAIELNPSNVEAHHMYSHYLLAMGRMEESLVESRAVLALDPLSSLGIGHFGPHYLSARQYDDAIRDLRTYLLKEPGDTDSYGLLGDAYYQKGMMSEALGEYLKQHERRGLAPEAIADLREAFAEKGINGYFRQQIKQLEAGGSVGYEVQIAGAYARLGEKDRAFEWLEKAYAEHAGGLVHLKEGGVFDNLRTDPRFAGLLRRIGLPPG